MKRRLDAASRLCYSVDCEALTKIFTRRFPALKRSKMRDGESYFIWGKELSVEDENGLRDQRYYILSGISRALSYGRHMLAIFKIH